MYYRLSEFWRVGYLASPLDVSLEYQDGSGRFDDPERKLAVLYGGDSATTCILEVALPWKPHVDATYVEQSEAPDEEMDAEEQRLALEEAERDREIAKRPPTMPASLYDSAKVFAQLVTPIVLCDLDDVSVRTRLSKVPARSRCNGRVQSLTIGSLGYYGSRSTLGDNTGYLGISYAGCV